jgi:hypothetical protein
MVITSISLPYHNQWNNINDQIQEMPIITQNQVHNLINMFGLLRNPREPIQWSKLVGSYPLRKQGFFYWENWSKGTPNGPCLT